MLTPIDIHNKEFKRSFRGYNEDEIDDFLDQVVNDYEKLFRDNERLKEERCAPRRTTHSTRNSRKISKIRCSLPENGGRSDVKRGTSGRRGHA